jgi:hypothetical protein
MRSASGIATVTAYEPTSVLADAGVIGPFRAWIIYPARARREGTALTNTVD